MTSKTAPDTPDAVATLDSLVRRALAYRASDIHLEPKRDGVRVRYRIDGVMMDQPIVDGSIAGSLANRIKVLARMDMTERRIPQDGQFSLDFGSGTLTHLRASTFPGIFGETIVLRLLLGHQILDIQALGLAAADIERARRILGRTSGLVICCGPTGSGKTSTLYSFLRVIDTQSRSVVTLEDPIEVEMPEITQGQTNQRTGFTFASGLRAILRQDPDVILVGEMRDPETAQIAAQASLTGHLVLSTLHTSSATETIVRLVDLGIEPWIVANSLLAVLGQRLVRNLCEHCAMDYDLPDDVRDDDGEVLIPKGTVLRQSSGCDACHDSGYRGRIGIFEFLPIDDAMRDLIKARASKREYRQAAERLGVTSLRKAGCARAKEGVTSLEEVLRVT